MKSLSGWTGRTSSGTRVNRPGAVSRLGFERAFGTDGWAGDQVDLQAGLLPQAGNGGQRVFLRAADHQPGDDVRDAHGVIWRRAWVRCSADGFELGGIGGRVGEIDPVIADGLIGLVLAPGNFAQAVGDFDNCWYGWPANWVKIRARGIQTVALI